MNRITQCIHGKGTVSSMISGSARNREKDAFLAYEPIPRPVIFWNLTGRCNLSCEHCYNASGPGTPTTDELTTEEALAFIDDCAGMRVPVLLFTGGEPLMRQDLWELASHARSRGIATALSTNGTLITDAVAGKIASAGIGYVGISLDGATATTHDRFRNASGAFDRAVEAFSQCRSAGIRCGVRMTLTKENYPELGAVIDLALRVGACRFCLYWLVPAGRGSTSYERLQLTRDEVFSALDILYRYASVIDPTTMEFLTVDGPQDAIQILRMMQRDQHDEVTEARSLIASMNGGCSAGVRVVNVTPAGEVYPCQFAQIPPFRIGSIREKKFSVIWNDPDNAVLSLFRKKKEILTGRCRTCSYHDLCGGGCRVRAYHHANDFTADDPFCFIR